MMSSIAPDVRKEHRQSRGKPVEIVHSVIYESRKGHRQYKEGAVEWCIPEAVEWYILWYQL